MKNKTLVITLHLIIMILAYTSPFWLDWKLIIAALAIYYLQLWVFGGCLLTFAQYGKWDETFSGRLIVWLGEKVGLKLGLKSVKRFLDFLPLFYIVISFIYQVLFRGPILLKI